MGASNYDIITDSTANLPDDLIKAWQLKVLPLEFIVDDISYKGYDPDIPTDNKRFYDMMREGKVIKTAMASVSDADRIFRESFASGHDVIYIGFDSVLSANYDVISAYLEQMRAESFPERKLHCVDTLTAALGEGLIVAEAVKRRDSGSSIDELAEWVMAHRLDVGCWFTVDDLKYLHRGGRLTAAAAFAGALLNILPVLHVDSDGHLVLYAKIRGRRRVLQYLADKVADSIVKPVDGKPVFISHADSWEACQVLMELIWGRCPGVEFVTNNLDPVVGAHTGPGTICVFFISTEGRG